MQISCLVEGRRTDDMARAQCAQEGVRPRELMRPLPWEMRIQGRRVAVSSTNDVSPEERGRGFKNPSKLLVERCTALPK